MTENEALFQRILERRPRATLRSLAREVRVYASSILDIQLEIIAKKALAGDSLAIELLYNWVIDDILIRSKM